jgi:SAM-dependent methyltransferase
MAHDTQPASVQIVGRPTFSRASGGYDARYIPTLRAVENRHFWFRARNAVLEGIVRRIEPTLRPDYQILEVGCGTGNTLRVLSRICTRGRVYGMDFQIEGLHIARHRTARPVLQGDIRRAPFGRRFLFDAVGMFDVLEHIDEDEAVLAAIRSQLVPDGLLLLTVPAGPELWSTFDVAAHHRRRYTAAELGRKLQRCGFSLEYLSPFMVVLYPLLWVRRRFSSRVSQAEDLFQASLAEFRIIPFANAALFLALRAEAPFIASRRVLPFGTSLLAVARRSSNGAA